MTEITISHINIVERVGRYGTINIHRRVPTFGQSGFERNQLIVIRMDKNFMPEQFNTVIATTQLMPGGRYRITADGRRVDMDGEEIR